MTTLLLKKPLKVNKMRENRDLKLDEVLEELYHLREENQQLKVDNDFLQRQNTACKLRCAEYSKRVMALEDEIADMRFTHKMLTAEEAGRAFARELLGKPMTTEEVAIEASENAYVPYNGDGF